MPDYYEPPRELLLPYLIGIERYEVWMMKETAHWLGDFKKEAEAQPELHKSHGVQKNVVAFLVHSRILYDFFAKEKPEVRKQDDSVCALHYLPEWDVDKARENPVLKQYFGWGKPVNTRAFHLSVKRLLEGKIDWREPEVSDELERLWNEFVPQARAALS